ncbi:MAG: hypothetical protein JST04_13115 [Bdellovibrionales bacterium]|nr:hypothetical protein [Bdellovibrionales bacterium]
MSSRFPMILVLMIALLGSAAARAEGRCILSQIESLDSNRTKEVLILADHLDVSGSVRGDRLWVSNDGTVKLRIQRANAVVARSELQIAVLVNDVTILRSTAQSYGAFVGTQASAMSSDGRAFSFICIAQSAD